LSDFNIDMRVDGYIKLKRIMSSVGLNQLMRDATRIISTSEMMIDLIFSNVDFDVEVRHKPKVMDHSVVMLIC